jgi:NADPH-dependent 7-cyano-7-deazaguanine reductase QueF-like protein
MTVVFQQINPFNSNIYKSFRFKAYINGYNETYDSSWDSIKYNGRSEFLYVFNSYKKTASFKLQLPSFNKFDLITNHENLKNLQTGAAGAYSQNRLGGVLTEIKLGGYLNMEPCIINSMAISIPNEASWDLLKDGSDNSPLSMLLEVNFNVTIIGRETPGYKI